MRDVKANSSSWLTEHVQGFSWQDGGGAFSVGPQDVDQVRAYSAKQEEHRKAESYKDEYLRFLKKHQVDFDPRCVFE